MSRATTPEAADRSRIANLDILRFIAAMLVVGYHYLFLGGHNGQFMAIDLGLDETGIRFAYYGVHLFFMISGFVILWTVQDNDPVNFSISRIARLWPAMAICSAITALVTVWYAQPPFEATLAQWLANLTFLAPSFGQPFMDGVYWTIVLELIFYFWIAILMIARIMPRYVVEVALVWLYFCAINELWLGSQVLNHGLMTAYGPWFIIGMLSFQLWSRGWDSVVAFILLVAVAMSMALTYLDHRDAIANEQVLPGYSGILLVNGLAIGAFLLAVFSKRSVPASRLVLAIGALTYPLYLLHQHVGYMMINTLEPALGAWLAVAGTTIAVLIQSWIVTTWWERPVGRLIKRGLKALANAMPILNAQRTVRG